jgi:putative ABC transport system permease protein
MSGSAAHMRVLRKGLVILQFTLSVFLIVSTGIVYRQVNYMHKKDLGFRDEQILVFPLRGEYTNSRQAAFKNELLNVPGVKSGTIGYGLPGDIFAGDDIIVPDGGKGKQFPVTQFLVDHDYIKTMGLQLLAGRDFSRSMATDPSQAFIINETAVKTLGLGTPEQAIGKPLHWNVWSDSNPDSLKKGSVIGVVRDFHISSLHTPINATVLQIFPDAAYKVALKVDAKNISQTIARVESVWNKFSPAYPLSYQFLDENFAKMYKSEEKLSVLLGIFTAVAIFIGCLGLLGLATYTAEQRVKEIGIRKTLGATVSNIIILLSKDFVKLVLLAVLIASPVAWWVMNKWIQDYAYRIRIGWEVFAIAGGAALLIAVLTVSFQAVRAAIANPVKSLRTE